MDALPKIVFRVSAPAPAPAPGGAETLSSPAAKKRSRPSGPPNSTKNEATRHREAGDRGCEWDTCTQTLQSLEDLVDHVEAHAHKSRICMWRDCPRKGETQPSTSAVIQHLRQHTHEKPHKCSVPWCEQRFVRNDIMLKHLKGHSVADGGESTEVQAGQAPHNYRGGGGGGAHNKRKAEAASIDDEPSPARKKTAPAAPTKVELDFETSDDLFDAPSPPPVSTPVRAGVHQPQPQLSAATPVMIKQQPLAANAKQPHQHLRKQRRRQRRSAAASLQVIKVLDESLFDGIIDAPKDDGDVDAYRARTKALKACFQYQLWRNSMLEDELNRLDAKALRLFAEKEVILDTLMSSVVE